MDKFLNFLKEYKIAVSVVVVLLAVAFFGGRLWRLLFSRNSGDNLSESSKIQLVGGFLTPESAQIYVQRIRTALWGFLNIGVDRRELENIVDFFLRPEFSQHRAHNARLLHNTFGSPRFLLGFPVQFGGKAMNLRGWIRESVTSIFTRNSRNFLWQKWDEFLRSANL